MTYGGGGGVKMGRETFEDDGVEDRSDAAPSHRLPASPEAGRYEEQTLPSGLQRG